MEEKESHPKKKGFWSGIFGGKSSKKKSKDKRKQMEKNKKIKKFSRAKPRNRKFRQEVDTNIVSIEFDVLDQDAQIAAGDAVFCQNCNTVFNKYSTLSNSKNLRVISEDIKMEEDQDGNEILPVKESDQEVFDEDDQIWICEFCDHKNIVNLEKEEIPTEDIVNYILEVDEEKQKKSNSDVSVIFCLDVSGSMCVTTPVKGKIKVKGDRLAKLQELMKFSDGSNQFHQESRNTTYISRLQCVQAAIEAQLLEMKNKSPEKKVGLVSFSNDVNIHGDCTQPPLVVSGDKLKDFDFLQKNGIDSTDSHMQKNIGEINEKLIEKLYELEESGPTALGPALLTAIGMATQGSAGSSVVLCTDGLSNIGLGSIIGKQNNAPKFYTQVADFAFENGVTVNIISIAGEECDLETLRCIPEKTGGEIQRVEADKLTENFANILSSPIIATDVTMKVFIHKGLEFRNEEEEQLGKDKSVLTKIMGNVTADSEMTFEYRIKDAEVLKNAKEFDISKLTQLPFQTQIEYTKLDGMKCIRTITKVQEITNDRREVEAEANAEILGTNCIQQTAKLARRGSFRRAQAYMKGQRKHWGDNDNNREVGKEVRSHLHKVQNMYGMLQNQNDQEEMYLSD